MTLLMFFFLNLKMVNLGPIYAEKSLYQNYTPKNRNYFVATDIDLFQHFSECSEKKRRELAGQIYGSTFEETFVPKETSSSEETAQGPHESDS